LTESESAPWLGLIKEGFGRDIVMELQVEVRITGYNLCASLDHKEEQGWGMSVMPGISGSV